MGSFQDLLNRFRKGEFNYERMGNIPEVQQRTNSILNDPRQMILNTDANYNNQGVVGPANVVPSQMPNAMGGMPTHGITQNLAPIPGTAMGNMGGMVTDFGKGIEAIKEAKDKGDGLMNPETRKMLEMLQGY
mgnify:CR=1 FL=1|tara:strand:+ start:1061 stop:1456 length:396 start_codon:yes stop_codon:yes gene_type:complete